MNALTRIDTRVVHEEVLNDVPVPMDVSLYGVVAAISVSISLHVGLAISWLTAGGV